MSNDAYRAEEARQVQILTDAIHKAIIETGEQFDAPILNAVGGALATNMAQILASISDRRMRKMFREQLDKAVTRSLANNLAQPLVHVETVVLGGIRQ
ncbi:hypothetical protein GGQ73_003209 [Rhizobium skierniewicense]|uniref:Uncharacterized protein n=1 Tax=Rhizobium skierniewicense TaxID=984260 RepID=A0A7W6C7N2_9HYPH|nr:hypothetical protein [Rhizobium skierniewicense]MBB3947243.1 hypothetical protein [Rhizobium skierniewicense]